MWSIGDVKSKGKTAFKANYFKSVLVALILSFVTAAQSSSSGRDVKPNEVSDTLVGLNPAEQTAMLGILFGFIGIGLIIAILLNIFVKNPLRVGCLRFFKKNVETQDAEFGVIKEGFGDYGRVFITLLLADIFTVLWTLLFIIPGIIKSYSYRMVPYIVKDNPELSATEVITRSRQMMNGNKWKAFLFDLSFIGWFLLSCITLGILLVFWTHPYYENANAALYLELSREFDSKVQ